jgi:hypothetical protein
MLEPDSELPNEQWQALTALHTILPHEHRNFSERRSIKPTLRPLVGLAC